MPNFPPEDLEELENSPVSQAHAAEGDSSALSSTDVWDTLLEVLGTEMPILQCIEQFSMLVQQILGANELWLFGFNAELQHQKLLIQFAENPILFPGFDEQSCEIDAGLKPILLKTQGEAVGWIVFPESGSVPEGHERFFNNLCTLLALLLKLQEKAELPDLQPRASQLRNLHSLITRHRALAETLRSSCREIAIELGADCAFCLARDAQTSAMQIVAGFGLPPALLESPLTLEHTSVGRALKVGGNGSIPDLNTSPNHGLQFLAERAISSINWSCIEGPNSLLGAVFVGYKTLPKFDTPQWSELEACASCAAIAIVTDEQRQQLDRYKEQLEELVSQRTQELAYERTRADQENQAKSRFVADMSHELRTPLTAIVGYSSVLARGVFGEISDSQKEALVSVTRAAEHLKDLLNEVLQIAKVEAGREQVQPSAIEVGSLIKQVSRMLLQSANSKNISVTTLSDDSPHYTRRIWMDQRHARQILLNLVSNAIKYTHPDGKVEIFAEPHADKIKIWVTDSGVGIPEEELLSVFERFTRGTHCYSQAQLGTGLGLPLTKELVEANGGIIGVESSPGAGSTFWILIPQADELLDTSSELNSGLKHFDQQLCKLDGLQILIVDDSKLTCEVLQSVIRQLGGTPMVAHSVKDALDIAQYTQFDAVLLDLAFPGESGMSLIDYFVDLNRRSSLQIPILAMSASVLETTQADALSRGASLFVSKPFDPLEVAYWVRTLVTSSALAAQATP